MKKRMIATMMVLVTTVAVGHLTVSASPINEDAIISGLENTEMDLVYPDFSDSSDDENIAEGSFDSITWVIDSSGKLIVKGNGEIKGRSDQDEDYYEEDEEPWNKYPEWYYYADKIVSAQIELSGTKDLSYLLYN